MKADNGADRCGKRFSVNEGTPRSVMLIGLSVNKNALQEGTKGLAFVPWLSEPRNHRKSFATGNRKDLVKRVGPESYQQSGFT